jgi:acyl carrier protein
MRSSELRTLILEWLDDNYHFGDAAALVRDDAMSWLDNGILTSLGFVELVLYLEDTLGITIDRGTLTRENFDGMGKVLGHVMKLLEGRA